MTDLHPEDKAKLGQVLGMKPSEIVAAAEVSDPDATKVVVETHDGQRVLLTSTDDGVTFDVTPWDGPMPGDGDAEGDTESTPDVPVGDPNDNPDAVPDGTVDEVLTWVGADKDRAARALEAEQAGKKRGSLVAQLEKLATA